MKKQAKGNLKASLHIGISNSTLQRYVKNDTSAEILFRFVYLKSKLENNGKDLVKRFNDYF